MLKEITPLILTWNEAPNIGRTLHQLRWASEVLLIDSYSTDSTLGIASNFANVRVVQRPFDTFAAQCNFGLTHIRTNWVLSLDADYRVDDEMVRELASLKPTAATAGYQVQFAYAVQGQQLRSCLYPPRVVLYRKDLAHYHSQGHAHKVHLRGSIQKLSSRITHDDRKPLERWLSEQTRYARLEAEHLLGTPFKCLSFPDRMRKMIVLAPVAVLFHTAINKGLALDGWAGLHYVLQRVYSELLLSLYLVDRHFRDGTADEARAEQFHVKDQSR